MNHDARQLRDARVASDGAQSFDPAPLYAAIDLGTNNCRLLVARRIRGGFRVVDSFSRVVCLGEGVGRAGVLSEVAMERTLAALKICADRIHRRGAAHVHCVATQACRQARNGADFVARVARETGLRLDIIDSDEEAQLAVLGCAPLLNPAVEQSLIFDIGGGSTEISWVTGVSLLQESYSVPAGVVTLHERFGDSTPYDVMVDDVYESLRAFEDKHHFRDAIARNEIQMLGTSGTVTTLVALYQKLPRYDRNRVDGFLLSRDIALALCQKIAQMSISERFAHPCIGRQRADLVVPGCAIFEALSRLWPVPNIRVADRGLREGMLLQMMAQQD